VLAAGQAGRARQTGRDAATVISAVWDADAVRDDLRRLITGRFGCPDAVLAVDETGDLKKGTHTVGVQRQYTGTEGWIENSKVGVFLGYAGTDGHTPIDRRVYLPASWTDDRNRCRAAGVPTRSSSPPSRSWPPR
jgi:SRSO17 transposase